MYLFHFEINFWFIRTSTSIFVWIKINWDCEVSATLYHLTYIFIHLVLVHPTLCNGIQCLVIFCQICIFISTFISSLVILALRIKRKINKSFHRISSTSGHSGTLFSTFRTRFKNRFRPLFRCFSFNLEYMHIGPIYILLSIEVNLIKIFKFILNLRLSKADTKWNSKLSQKIPLVNLRTRSLSRVLIHFHLQPPQYS